MSKIIAAMVVGYDHPGRDADMSEHRKRTVTFRAFDGTEHECEFDLGRDVQHRMGGTGMVVPADPKRNIDVPVIGRQAVLHVDKVGRVIWFHWPILALEWGWWQSLEGMFPGDALFRVIDPGMEKVNGEPFEPFMGAGDDMQKFLMQEEANDWQRAARLVMECLMRDGNGCRWADCRDLAGQAEDQEGVLHPRCRYCSKPLWTGASRGFCQDEVCLSKAQRDADLMRACEDDERFLERL